VEKWQFFLRGVELYLGEVDGMFGEASKQATEAFQRRHGLQDDGIAGNRTLGEAMRLGFAALPDTSHTGSAPQSPSEPDFGPLGAAGREHRFGEYTFVSEPVKGNPEAIRITSDWVGRNIQRFKIPQLAGVKRAPASGELQFHRLVGPRVVELFARWEGAGLLPAVLSFDGAFVTRFIRGSRSVLSSHAHGSAFDINAEWNGFGIVPAAIGARGSVRELVAIAHQLGFYWGGHFGKPDGMHFELARL
jgi:hypothetical protein